MESNVPKFKSSYQPKTRYGQVVKDYYENNPTPSVNWMMGENTAYMNQYGSNYGAEDVEALSREYVLYRDANGLSANYNASLTPWVEQVRANAAATNGGVATPMAINPTVAATPAPQAQPQAATMDNDPFFQQIAKNKAIDNTKLDGGVPAVAAAPAPAVASTAPTASTATPAAAPTPTPTPAATVSTPNVDNTGAVVEPATGTAQKGQTVAGGAQVVQPTTAAQPAPAANNVAQQIMHNTSETYEKLEQSGLPTATIEAIKAQSGLGEIGKNYQAEVKQAETDYARAQSRYGRNAEYLAQSGLNNSGYSDAADNAAYAAMQGAKVSAGEAALEEQLKSQRSLWDRVTEEEDKIREQERLDAEQAKLDAEEQEQKAKERESELLGFVSNKGLSGQEAINYLVAGGVDQARAEEIVGAQIDPIYNAAVAKAAQAYVDAIKKGAEPNEAPLILEDEYSSGVIEAAVKKGEEYLNSDEYKSQKEKEASQKLSEGLVLYQTAKAEDQSEELIQSQLKAAGYNYAEIKGAYDDDRAKKLKESLSRMITDDVDGAVTDLKQILEIADSDWDSASTQGTITKLLRERADVVFSSDSELRGLVYAQTVEFDMKSALEDESTDMIKQTQSLVDEWARRGILTGEKLKSARHSICSRVDVTTESIDPDDKEYTATVNDEEIDFDLEDVSEPEGALWTTVGGGVALAVVNEKIYIAYKNGSETVFYKEVDNDGSELTNILVNKYRGNGKKLSDVTL